MRCDSTLSKPAGAYTVWWCCDMVYCAEMRDEKLAREDDGVDVCLRRCDGVTASEFVKLSIVVSSEFRSAALEYS